MSAQDGVAELVREFDDEFAGPLATRYMQEVKEGEVEKDWLEDFPLDRQLECVKRGIWPVQRLSRKSARSLLVVFSLHVLNHLK